MNDQRSFQLACLWTLWALTAGGCATTPPATFYTLSPTIAAPLTAAFPSPSKVTMAIGPLVLPEFLNRPQIVVRMTSNRIEVAEFHRWGGSLQEDFSRILAQNLSSLMATDGVQVYSNREQSDITYRLAIDIQQFDGRPGEGVTLNAIWTLVDEQTTDVLLVRRFAFLAPVERPGAAAPDYEGLVAAHSAALAALSQDIARQIGSLKDWNRR